MQIKGNTILITGGASGIGRALAKQWHAAGNQIIIAGRRKDPIDEMLANHAGMVGYVLDIQAPPGHQARFAEQVAHEHGAFNVLVNNAEIMVVEDWPAIPGLMLPSTPLPQIYLAHCA